MACYATIVSGLLPGVMTRKEPENIGDLRAGAHIIRPAENSNVSGAEVDETKSARFVKLHVRVTANPVWTQLSPAVFKVFVAFVIKANFQDSTWYDGSTERRVPRGSFVTSYAKMANFCNLSLQQARDAFSHLQRLGIATYSRTYGPTIVTVSNYETYQSKKVVGNTTENTSENTPENIAGTEREHTENTERNIAGTPSIESVEVVESLSGKSLLEQAVERVAARLHGRHPAVRRCSLTEVKKKLRSIVKDISGVSAKVARLEAIDRIHEGWCAHPEWKKEGGEYAKGLGNWLAPTLGRFDIPAPGPPKQQSIYKDWVDPYPDHPVR